MARRRRPASILAQVRRSTRGRRELVSTVSAYQTPVDQLRRHRPPLYDKLKDTPPKTIAAVAKEVAHTFKAESKLRLFVKRFDPGPPRSRPLAPDWRFPWETLDAALGVIYAHRSADLHAGIAFPWPLCLPPYEPDDGPAARAVHRSRRRSGRPVDT